MLHASVILQPVRLSKVKRKFITLEILPVSSTNNITFPNSFSILLLHELHMFFSDFLLLPIKVLNFEKRSKNLKKKKAITILGKVQI